MNIAPEQLEPIQALYDRGLYLQAHVLASAHAPLRQWTGGLPRVLGGRLASIVGAVRLGRALYLYLRAFRESPTLPQARYFYVVAMVQACGEAQNANGDGRTFPSLRYLRAWCEWIVNAWVKLPAAIHRLR